MLGKLLKKYSSTELKPSIALVQNGTRLFTAQNDPDIKPQANPPLSPQAQKRRDKVIAMLNANPLIERALIDDHDNDPLNVILTLAVRDIGTIELMLAKTSYDGLAIITCLESLQTTH